MNKKLIIAWAVVFAAWMFGSFIVHGVLLHEDYAKLPQLFRPDAEAQQYCWFMVLAHVLMSGAFVWIYSRGIEDKPWCVQGARFGFMIAMLMIIPLYTIYYVVQPMPGIHVIKQIIFDSVLVVFLGMVTAFLLKPSAQK